MSLEEKIAAAPAAVGEAPSLRQAAKFAEVESFANIMAERVERLEGALGQICSTTKTGLTEIRTVISGSGPAPAPSTSPVADSTASASPWANRVPDPMSGDNDYWSRF